MFKMMVRMIMIVHCSPVFVTMMMERMISTMTTMMFVEMMMLFNVYCTINVHIMASFFDSGFCVTMLMLKLWHIWIFLLLLLLLLLWILLFMICFIQGLLWLPHGLICWYYSSCRCCGIGDLGRTAAWGTYSYATKESNNHKIASVLSLAGSTDTDKVWQCPILSSNHQVFWPLVISEKKIFYMISL